MNTAAALVAIGSFLSVNNNSDKPVRHKCIVGVVKG